MNLVLSLGTIIFGILFLFLFSFATLILLTVTTKQKEYDDVSHSISVIIPAYNEANNIERCITSFQDQTHDDYEIIIVDDGSTDNTRSIINDHDVTLLTQDHNGKVTALNTAYEQAEGDIIVAADADTAVKNDFLESITRPFGDKAVGAVSGAVTPFSYPTALNAFQTVEYYYNNIIRHAVSHTFSTDIWFFGCIAAYRRDALDDINGFPKDSLTEDMDTNLELRRHGWNTLHEPSAQGQTEPPRTMTGLAKQRQRWWGGGYQLLSKHRDLLHNEPTFTFIFYHHWWWAAYAVTSVPLLAYQYSYWLPTGIANTAWYTFRWFTLLGPIIVFYNAASWLSAYNVFGVSSGILTAILIATALWYYEKSPDLSDAMALFLYFPYTILLNAFILLGLYKARLEPEQTYIE